MKQSIYMILFTMLVLTACEEDRYYIEPSAGFEMSTENAEVLEIVNFNVTGEGQFFTFFTGDLGHNYDNRENGDVGLSPNQYGEFLYSYTSPGTYKVVLVASGYNYSTDEQVSKTAEKTITISDTRNSIEELRFQKFGAYRSGTDLINLVQEGKPGPNNSFSVYLLQYTRIVDVEERRNLTSVDEIDIMPIISLESPASNVKVGSTVIESGNTLVDHTENGKLVSRNYVVTAHDGSTKTYKVGVMAIPEFKTFTVAGQSVSSENTGDHISKYMVEKTSYHSFRIVLDVDDATDVSSQTPEFTLWDDNVQVFVNDQEQQSGNNSHDFTNPVVYTLTYVNPDDPDFAVSSEIEVVLN